MYNPIRISSKTKPKKFVDLRSGNWYYNYDIKSQTITIPPTEEGQPDREETIYSFVQIKMYGKPTLYKCIKAVLKKYKNKDGISMYEASSLGLEQGSEYEDVIHHIKVDFDLEEELSSLDYAKKQALKKINEYDVSDNVNSFFLNGTKVWLNKDTRVGLMNSLTIEKNSGKETSTLWFGNIKLDINTEAAIQMLSALELYALKCYNKTAEHKVNIENMTSVEDVVNYNFTEGYPDKLNFSI